MTAAVDFPDLDLITGHRLIALNIATSRLTASVIRTFAFRAVRRPIDVVHFFGTIVLQVESVIKIITTAALMNHLYLQVILHVSHLNVLFKKPGADAYDGILG